MRTITGVAAAAAIVAAAAIPAAGQKTTAADVAKQMSGTWTINLALSPAFSPGRSNGGRRGGGPAYAMAGMPLQRGGRGGAGGGADTPASSADLTPSELAERTAMASIQQIAAKITVAATTETFTITDERGEQTCAINDKKAKLKVGDAEITVKCRWDKDKLRQEFSSTRSGLVRTWAIDEGGRLVLKGKLEGVGQNTLEATAVFDRSDK